MRRHAVRFAFALSAAAAVLSGPTARSAQAADFEVDSVMSLQNRDGAWLREDPKPFGKKLAYVPLGTSVTIVAVRETWGRVSTQTEPSATGWLKLAELAPRGSLAGGAATAPTLVSAEVSAAGRQLEGGVVPMFGKLDTDAALRQAKDPAAGKQFDRKSELTMRGSDPELNAAFAKVDALERATPSDKEIEEFVREGRLGGTATAGTPNGQGSYAKLKLLGATGQAEGVKVFESAYTPLPPVAGDAEFVERLGVGLTADQEYWVGRAVAAQAILKYGLDPDESRQALVRRVGQSIVTLSERLRVTHGGYHFAVLDTAVPNGMSGPGGFVLVTRGALDLARNEDEIAGILAHEMAHIAYKHGEQVIRKTREFQNDLVKAKERLARGPTAGLDCNLCGAMAKALADSANGLVKTLDEQGYGKEYELDADWAGSLFLCEVGYRASAIAEYLEMLPKREGARWTTHPESGERIEALRPLVFKHGCPFETDEGAQARLPRFHSLAQAAVAPADAVPPLAPAAPTGTPRPGGDAPPTPPTSR